MLTFSTFLFVAAIFGTFTIFRGRVMNPLMAYFPIYLILIICYRLGLTRGLFQLEVVPPASWLLMGSMASVFFGVLMAVYRFKPRRLRTAAASEIDYELALIQKLSIYSLVLFYFIVAYKYSVLNDVYGAIFPDLGDIRTDYVIGDLKSKYGLANWAGQFMQIFLAMNIGTLLGARSTATNKVITFLFFVCEVLNDLTIGGAFNTFIILIVLSLSAFASYEILANGQITWRHIRFFGICAVVVWLCALTIFENRGKGNLLSIGAKPSDVVIWYAGGDISTFQYFFDHPVPSLPPGRHLFGGLYGIADTVSGSAGLPFLSERDPTDYLAYIPVTINTSIYLSYIYSDFGTVGVLMVSFVMGFVPAYLHFKALRLKRFVDVQYLVLALLAVFMSIRVVLTEAIYYWILIAILAFQNQMICSIKKTGGRLYRSRTSHQGASAN